MYCFSFCRHAHIGKDHLLKLMKQLLLSKAKLPHSIAARGVPNAADVPTLLGTGSFSLLGSKLFFLHFYIAVNHPQNDLICAY